MLTLCRDHFLIRGYGCCALSDPCVREIVAARLHHFDKQQYELESYVIMPNHVHVLFTPTDENSLAVSIQGWKGVSSRMIHKAGLSKLDPFWQPEYFDRLIRNADHFAMVQSYTRENPVKARLRSCFLLWERG